jgi:predicted RND superfamily exporter protein
VLQENFKLLMEQLQSAEVLTVQERQLLASVMRFVESSQGSRDDRLAELDAAIFGDLREQLQSLELSLLAERFGRSDLPRELAERWFSEDNKQLIEIAPAENISENIAASRFVDAVRSVLPNATGYPVVYREAASTVVISFQMALVFAVILVTAVLLFFLRRLLDCALVLVPILCAAIVTAGMTVWLSMPFNFANIIALPLLIGVGVDNAIHMVHRMRTEAVSLAAPMATSTSVAVFASGLTTIASFGNLGFSTHRGMATMGALLTLGMVTTMLATLVFLPALMRLRVFR